MERSDLDPILDVDDAQTRAEPVKLAEIVRGPVKCCYVVIGGKTKFQLFPVGGRFTETFGEAVKTTAPGLFGSDAKVEFIPEVDSWYVELPRAMADGGKGGAEKLLDQLTAGGL